MEKNNREDWKRIKVWKFLVHASGTYWVDLTKQALDKSQIEYRMEGSRKDEIEFFVPENWYQEAKQFVQENS